MVCLRTWKLGNFSQTMSSNFFLPKLSDWPHLFGYISRAIRKKFDYVNFEEKYKKSNITENDADLRISFDMFLYLFCSITEVSFINIILK